MRSLFVLWATLFAATAISPVCAAPQKKGKSPKPPDLEVMQLTVHRESDKVAVEGRVKNVGEKPIAKLNLLFDFFAPGRQPLETKRGELDTELLDVGEEAEFRWELVNPARAVQMEIRAEDGNGRDLRTVRTGPFPIE